MWFADDTLILVGGNTAEKIEAGANRFNTVIHNLFQTEGRSSNLEKTELLVYNRHTPRIHKTRTITLITVGSIIQPIPTFKYLGVIPDSTLNWRPHVQYVMFQAE